MAYGKKGQYDQAISDYNKALEINPRMPWPTVIGEWPLVKKAVWSGDLGLHEALQIQSKGCLGLRQPGKCLLPKRPIWPGDLGLQQGSWNQPKRRFGLLRPRNCILPKRPVWPGDLDYNKALEISPKDAEAYYNREWPIMKRPVWSGNLGLQQSTWNQPKGCSGLLPPGKVLFVSEAIWQIMEDVNRLKV